MATNNQLPIINGPKVALNNTVVTLQNGPAILKGWTVHNPNGSEAWIQFFNKNPSDVVLGTTAPDYTLKFAANSSTVFQYNRDGGRWFNTYLSWAATTTETGSTGNGTALSAYGDYI